MSSTFHGPVVARNPNLTYLFIPVPDGIGLGSNTFFETSRKVSFLALAFLTTAFAFINHPALFIFGLFTGVFFKEHALEGLKNIKAIWMKHWGFRVALVGITLFSLPLTKDFLSLLSGLNLSSTMAEFTNPKVLGGQP